MDFENLIEDMLEKINSIKFYKTLEGRYVAEFYYYPDTTKWNNTEARTLKRLFENIKYIINKEGRDE